MIKVSSISKRYGKIEAVSDVSFVIDKGDIVGFIGRNGAGKSTTMNIMTGCLAASGGTVSIDGFDISQEAAEAKKRIGYLPEQPPLYNAFTVYEYLDVMCDMKGIKTNKKAHINEIAEKTGIAEVIGRRTGNLSKGYKQRIGLAQALLGYPAYLVLDEPTAGLDPKQKSEMLRLIKTLGNECGIILSSHILSEIDKVCNKILIIEKGRIAGCEERESDGGEKMEYIIRGSREAVAKALSPVCRIEAAESAGPETVRCIVRVSGDEQISDIFFALAEHKLPVMELKKYADSAEKLFIKVASKH